jgi:hypothetical protein
VSSLDKPLGESKADPARSPCYDNGGLEARHVFSRLAHDAIAG